MSKYKRITVQGKRIPEHRYVMEQILCRHLTPTEHIHHKDHNTLNNHPDNLQLVDLITHRKIHATFRSETHKQCIYCLKVKSRCEFSPQYSKPKADSHSACCKNCARLYQRHYRKFIIPLKPSNTQCAQCHKPIFKFPSALLKKNLCSHQCRWKMYPIKLYASAIKGQNKWNSKLTDDDVRFIRHTAPTYGYLKRLSKRFGMNTCNIWKVKNKLTWKHIK